MEFRKILTLRGPNIWSRHAVLEAWVDLGALKDSPSASIPGFNERLMSWLPTMVEHRCSIGERGGFFQRLRDGTYPAHILEHVTLELQTLAGTPVGFGKARETSEEGVYKVVVRYRDEQLARACLFAARELLLAAIHDQPYDLQSELRRLRNLADRVCLGPSTAAIVAAAEKRGIPARRLNAGSLVQLGWGTRQRRIWTAETDRTSAIAESIAQDKELTKTLLRAGGVPVPEGRSAVNADDAWEAAQEVGLPVVVKPRDANHGRGVFTNLTSADEVRRAFELAAREGTGVIVERFAPGAEHRLLVVGDRLIAAARGEAAYVTGDGRSTIRQLVDEQLNSDPRRGDDETFPLSPIVFDDVTLMQVERQGYTPDSIPPHGAVILMQRNDNLSTDVTDRVHTTTVAHAVQAAKIVGLDVAGLDLVVEDISRALEEQGGVVVEVNAGPGLLMHLKPSIGEPRPVGEAIIDSLFPPGQNGRIPLVCVTGTNGKTTVVRLIAHLLQQRGDVVGTACSDGIQVAGRTIERGDCSGPRSARKVLLNPYVEAAVLEAGRGGILREGLGFDRCEVAVVTNIGQADHLGLSYIETPEQMFNVKRCGVDVVLPTGAAVLNAQDPLVAPMKELCAGSVIFFARDVGHPVLAKHLEAGHHAVFARDGRVIAAHAGQEWVLGDLSRMPLALGGKVAFQVENILAAAAAAWWLRVPAAQIAQGLESFAHGLQQACGRFQTLDYRGAKIVIDDCHNISALEALIAALQELPYERRTIVYSAGDGRRDQDLVQQGRMLSEAFDRVVLYEDVSAAERAEGEISSLFLQGFAPSDQRAADVLEIRRHSDAVAAALALAGPGEVVVIQTEDDDAPGTVERVLAFVGEEQCVSPNQKANCGIPAPAAGVSRLP
jgi:cyanophycin synthetase